jgi:hypothetical protein
MTNNHRAATVGLYKQLDIILTRAKVDRDSEQYHDLMSELVMLVTNTQHEAWDLGFKKGGEKSESHDD